MEENSMNIIALIAASVGIGFIIIGLMIAFNAAVRKLKQIKNSNKEL